MLNPSGPGVALPRLLSALTSSPCAFHPLAILPPSRTLICPQALSRTSRCISTRRQLQTATAHRPQTLDTEPPPPRNTGTLNPSVAGSIPEVNDTRPPRMIGEQGTNLSGKTDGNSNISVPTEETHKGMPTSQTTSGQPSSSPTSRPKRSSKLRPRKAAMTLTPAAIRQLHDLLSEPEPKLIRVGVKNRGCSGLAYHLEYVEKPGTFDETVEQDGVKVLIDSKALFSIIGSEMDWVEDKLNRRFIFRNPNIKEQCGCGESFMV